MAETKKKTEEKKEEFNKPAKADKPIAGGYITPMTDRDLIRFPGVKRFIITSAQNNTYVNEGFLKSLETCAKETDATIIASQFTYNQNGFQNGTKDNEELWYDERLEPYFHRDETGKPRSNRPIELAPGLILGGELNILPTTALPLSGFESYFRGNNSGIVPHAKQQMKSLAGTMKEGAHFQYTTGAVTQRNYIEKKAGQKADKNHIFGALIVEIDEEGDWFVRQVQADRTGGFYDLDPKTGKAVKYMPDGSVVRSKRPLGIKWGDGHEPFLKKDMRELCWGKGGILETIYPYEQFIGDLFAMHRRGKHSINDPFHWAAMRAAGTESVEDEVADSAKLIKNDMERDDIKTNIEASNHHDHFLQWLMDPKAVDRDPANSAYWHECKAKIEREIMSGNMGFQKKILEWAIRNKAELKNTKFLSRQDDAVVGETADGYGVSHIHGDKASNGSRGTPAAFRKAARRVNTGHTHSASIIDGVFTCGVLGDLDQGYNNESDSSWSHTNTITYKNTARTHFTIKRSKKTGQLKWRAPANDNKPKSAPKPKKVKKLKPK